VAAGAAIMAIAMRSQGEKRERPKVATTFDVHPPEREPYHKLDGGAHNHITENVCPSFPTTSPPLATPSST
jgi:hypothetical protein